MAFTSDTTYGPGGGMNITSQLSGLQGMQGMDLGGLAAALLRKQPTAPKNTYAPRLSLSEQNMQRAQQDAATAKAQEDAARSRAMMQQSPKRYIFGLGYAGGPDQFTPDYANMTAIQKQIAAPQQAQFMGGGPSYSAASFAGQQADPNQAAAQALSDTAFQNSQAQKLALLKQGHQ